MAAYALKQSLAYHHTYRNTIWKQENYADCGGYYSYLIMWFDIGYESKHYPSDYQLERGLGVRTDSGPIVKTKYTCGVAYLLTPFYLGNRLIGQIAGYNTHANDVSNKIMIDVAGSFYLWLGAVLMFLLARKYASDFISFISTLFIVLGTNIIFYGTMHPGMSHIYSFFLTSLVLYSAYNFFKLQKKIWLIPLALGISCIVLIRPTNVLIIPLILFMAESRKQLLTSIQLKWIFLVLLVGIIVWIPQFNYWYKLNGTIIYYSYQGEGFIYWLQPKWLIVLFSPLNGLLLYSPFIVVLLAIIVFQSFQRNHFSQYLFFLFVITTYLSASWHAPAFGCGYGQRNFVEILPAMVIPLSLQFKRCTELKRYLPLTLMVIFSVIFTLVNLQLIRKYNHCSWAQRYWDFKSYWYNLNPYKITLSNEYTTYFEKDRIGQSDDHSYLIIKPEHEITHLLSIDYYKVPEYVKKAYFISSVKTSDGHIGFDIEIWVTDHQKIYFGNTIQYINKYIAQNKWSKISGIIYLHFNENIPKNCGLFVYLINKNKQEILIDRASVTIE